MADFTIDAQLKLDALNAIRTVDGLGKKLDDTIGKGNTVLLDTKKAETDIKQLGELADKTLSDVGSKSAGGGMFSGLGESLAGLVSPAGLATAGVAALGAGLAASFQIGAEFQKNLAAVSAITDITGASLDDIGNRAQDLAAKFGGSASTQLEAFQGVLSRFGAQLADTPDDLGKVSESINLLAKAGGIDAAAAMDTLTTAMLQFGVDTSNSSELAAESARFINVMAASARVGAAEIPQVGEAVKVAGVAMKGAKVSFEEGNAAIQVLAAGGKVGAEAGTALRNVLGKLAGEEVIPKEALDKLKGLGVDMKKVSDTSKPLSERLQELGKASKDATAFSQVFGAENAAAATILAQGAGTVRDWTKEITGTQDASKQAAVNMGTLTEQLGRAKAAFENTLINVNKVLSPILAEAFGTITQVFGKVQDAIAPIFSRLSKTFGELFTKIKPVFAAIIGFLGGAWLVQITTIFSAIGTAINVVFTTAIKIFDAVVAAVTPLVDALKKAFGFSDDASKSIDVLKIFGDVLTFISDGISAFGDILIEVGGFIAEFLIAPFKIVISVVTEIVKFFTPATKAVEDTGKAAESTGGFFSTLVDIIKQAPAFIRAVTEGFKAFVGGVTDLITNFSFDKLKNLLTGKTIADAFTGSIDKSKLDKLQKEAAVQFESSLGRLAELRTKANLAKDADEKKAASDTFKNEQTSLIERINQKEKAGELEKSVAEKLRVDALKLTLAGAKDEEDAAKKSADKKKEKAKKDNDDSFKIWLENRKLLDDAEVKRIADDTEREIRASQLKEEREIETVLNSIKNVKKETDKNAAEKKFEIDLLEKQISAIMINEQANREAILRKEQKEAEKEHLKDVEARNKEVEKINADLDKKEAEANRKAIEERITAEQKYAETHKSIFEQLADSTTDIFTSISQSIADAFKPGTSGAKEATDAARKEAETQLADLKKSLKDKTIAFADYQDKVAEINSKIAESGAIGGKSFGESFVDGLNKSLSAVGQVFDNISKGILRQYDADNKELADINKELKKEISLQEKFSSTDTIEQAEERKKKILKLSQQQADGQISTGEQLDTAMKTIALSVSGAMVSAAAAGENLWQAFVLSTLDAMNALIPLFTALILGKQLSELGLPGLLVAGGLIAAMTALVAVARSAVSENGFYQGGYTGAGSDNTVKGVVHEEEYVFSKRAVKREVSAFDELHNTLKNGVSLTEIMQAYKYPELSNTFVGGGGIVHNFEITPQPIPVFNSTDMVGELRAQTNTLSRKLDAVLEATEHMPTAFRGNMKLDANIKLDKGAMLKEITYNNRRKGLQ